MEERWSTRLDPRTPRGVTAGAGRNIVKPKRGATEGKTHTHTFTHNIRIGKTPVGWAGSKQEAGQPERGIVSPGLVSFGDTSE
jgi:hypothetical protein